MSNEVTIAKHNIDEEPNTPTKFGVEEFQPCYYLKLESLKQLKLALLQNPILCLGLKKISNLYLKHNQQDTNFQI